MGRAPCCDKGNVKRGPWSPEEDAILRSYVEMYGTGGNWIALPQKAGLKRCGKSCRLRWLNYLRPDIKHGGFTEEEDTIICSLYNSIGSRWSIIASKLPGRTDNDIKNYWNTKLKKKFMAGLVTTTTSSSSRSHHHLPPPPPPLPLPDHLPTIKAESFAMPSEDLLAQVYAFTAHQTRPKVSPSTTEEVSASSSSITVDNNNNNNSSNNNNNNNNNNSSSYNWSIDGNGGDDAFFFSELGFGSPMASDFNCFSSLSSTWGSNSAVKPQGMYQSLTSFLLSEMQDKEMS